MSFTDRFLIVRADLYDTENVELVGYGDSTRTGSVDIRINPFEISHYRDSTDDIEGVVSTMINFKNGDNFHISMSVEEFEHLLNSVK